MKACCAASTAKQFLAARLSLVADNNNLMCRAATQLAQQLLSGVLVQVDCGPAGGEALEQ